MDIYQDTLKLQSDFKKASENRGRHIRLNSPFSDNLYTQLTDVILMPRDGIRRLDFMEFYEKRRKSSKSLILAVGYEELRQTFSDIDDLGMNIQYITALPAEADIINHPAGPPFPFKIIRDYHFSYVQKLQIAKKEVKLIDGKPVAIEFPEVRTKNSFCLLHEYNAPKEYLRVNFKIPGTNHTYSGPINLVESVAIIHMQNKDWENDDSNLSNKIIFDCPSANFSFTATIEEFILESE